MGEPTTRRASPADLRDAVLDLVRAFGLHQADRTPCGQPIAISEAHARLELGSAPPLTQGELATRLRLRLRLQKSTVSRLVGQMVRT